MLCLFVAYSTLHREPQERKQCIYSVYNCTVCMVLLLCWDNNFDRDFGDVFCGDIINSLLSVGYEGLGVLGDFRVGSHALPKK